MGPWLCHSARKSLIFLVGIIRFVLFLQFPYKSA
jgi:hypothetical protein